MGFSPAQQVYPKAILLEDDTQPKYQFVPKEYKLKAEKSFLKLRIYQLLASEWQYYDFDPAQEKIRIGRDGNLCDLVLGEAESDPVQVMIISTGFHWIIIETGSNRLTQINGFKKQQQFLAKNDRCLLKIGASIFLLSCFSTQSAKLQSALHNQDYIVIKDNIANNFSFNKMVLLGSSEDCDVHLDGEPFAAVVSAYKNTLYFTAITGYSEVAVEGNAELIGDSVLLKSGDLVTINGATLKFLNPKQAVMNNFHVIPNFNNSRFSLISLDQDSGHGSFILPTSGKTISVGRDATCNFCINSNRISRVHAQILVFDNQLIVCDQQSRNGTYVNDEKIEKKELHPGDILEFGDNRYLLGYSE